MTALQLNAAVKRRWLPYAAGVRVWQRFVDALFRRRPFQSRSDPLSLTLNRVSRADGADRAAIRRLSAAARAAARKHDRMLKDAAEKREAFIETGRRANVAA